MGQAQHAEASVGLDFLEAGQGFECFVAREVGRFVSAYLYSREFGPWQHHPTVSLVLESGGGETLWEEVLREPCKVPFHTTFLY